MPKVVFITGAAKRIGAEIARLFHERGFNVIIHANKSVDAANALVASLNQQRADSAAMLQADLTVSEETENLGASALRVFNRLDVLVNNASSFYPTPLGKIDSQQWNDLIDSNLRAGFFLSQQLAPEISNNQGAIINLVDTHADRPLAGFPAYSIAKAGVKAMTRSLAIELAPNVRVNGVSPGAILWPPALEDDNDPQVIEKRQQMLKQVPLNRLGETREIAEAVYYLAVEASYITGHVIKVDGGRSLR
ncbi:MAG: pteridine reductase [Pseudohongiellaceae bacterium]|jgi:pteridine reductase